MGMLDDVRKVNETAGKSKTEEDEVLDTPVEEPTEDAPALDAPAEEEDAPAVAAEAEEPETLISIGGREFKTQSEAIRYAEELEQEKLLAESYNQGIRETLALTQKPVQAQEEDNFDEQFYSNPKEALKKVKEQAKDEIMASINAKDAEKAAWNRFSQAHPDLADSEKEVRRVLQENWDVLGNMKDEKRAMEILATKTRSYFQSIAERVKPRTVLSNRGGQVVSPSGKASSGVTPNKREERPLTMIEQMQSLRRNV
jgi:hypothetical protein